MNETPIRTEPAGPPLPLFGQERDRIPERIGPFRILDLLAEGMALVYKAEQDNPRRLVALKIPRGGQLLSPESRRRFLRETALAAQLDHPGIVPILEAGQADGVPFYTMPFIEGRSLAQHLAMVKPDRKARLHLFLRICGVVNTLHRAGLVHRDLKPENIMIDRHGEVRLLDFGLARATDDTDGLSGDQALLGTLPYMAPEQTKPSSTASISPATDVYALGVILYGLLTDKAPYSTDGVREAALAAIRDSIPEPPSAILQDISPPLDSVTLRCLAKDPAQRPTTAGDLARMLNAALENKLPAELARPRSLRGLIPLVLAALALLIGIWLLGKLRQPAAPLAPVSALTAAPPPAVSAPVQTVPEVPRLVEPRNLGRLESLPLPDEARPLYEAVMKALREEFDHRSDGAMILKIVSAEAMNWKVSWTDPRSLTRISRAIRANEPTVLFLPGDKALELECQAGESRLSATVSTPLGQTIYCSLHP